MKLYHGSTRNIDKTLTPHKAFSREDYEPRVYFTDLKEKAIAYAINPIDSYIKSRTGIDQHYSAMSAHMRYAKGVLEIMECYPNMFEIYHSPAYIYVCNVVAEKKNDHEYILKGEVDFAEKLYIEDVYSELIKLEKCGILKLYKYDDLDCWKTYHQYDYVESGLQSRASYCSYKEELDFFEMVSHYFPKIKQHIKLVSN